MKSIICKLCCHLIMELWLFNTRHLEIKYPPPRVNLENYTKSTFSSCCLLQRVYQALESLGLVCCKLAPKIPMLETRGKSHYSSVEGMASRTKAIPNHHDRELCDKVTKSLQASGLEKMMKKSL